MEHQNKKGILVPTDFSEACDNAMNHAIKLAQIMDLGIIALHVINKDTKSYIKKNNLSEKDIEFRLKDYIAGKQFDRIEPTLEEGDIFTTIGETAIEKDCQMIILGTHGKFGFQQITGSYALKVIDSTALPVICVQNRDVDDGYKKIIFPIRLGDQDRQKAEFAVMLAKAFDSVIHIFPHYENDEGVKSKIMPRIKQLKNYFDKYEINYIDVLSNEYGDKYDRQILNYSNSVGADLVLIMSNPEKHGPLFGAWEENIIFNSAQIPVMCVNAKRLASHNYVNQSGYWAF